jgi:hypothetical protein
MKNIKRYLPLIRVEIYSYTTYYTFPKHRMIICNGIRNYINSIMTLCFDQFYNMSARNTMIYYTIYPYRTFKHKVGKCSCGEYNVGLYHYYGCCSHILLKRESESYYLIKRLLDEKI